MPRCLPARQIKHVVDLAVSAKLRLFSGLIEQGRMTGMSTILPHQKQETAGRFKSTIKLSHSRIGAAYEPVDSHPSKERHTDSRQ